MTSRSLCETLWLAWYNRLPNTPIVTFSSFSSNTSPRVIFHSFLCLSVFGLMRNERICSLSRTLIAKPAFFANTLSIQWMERTLDDSAIRKHYWWSRCLPGTNSKQIF
ncbi:hypothetical protein F5X96DRAFT_600767 [Biscogniauxia mediterranea]|nr:hypothetical protein F5X96DRAFT_600767 [Biscogniauxia mediterranea]